MSTVPSDTASRRRARWLAFALAAFAVVGGASSFYGYVADLPRLTDWYDNGISIQPNTTLAVTASGVSVLLLLWGYRRSAFAAATLVSAIGALTLFQYASGLSIGIDDLFLFGREWGRVAVVWPGRMGLPAAISWTVIGVSLLLASTRNDRARGAAPYGVLGSALIASLSLIGYMYGSSPLFTIPILTAIALQTSTFIIAASLALVLAVPDKGPMVLLADDGPAGTLVRRLLPGVILLPLVLGRLRLAGERAGLYDLEFGTAARTLVEIVLLLSLVWWTSRSIARLHDDRARAETALAQREHDLRTTLEGLTDGLVTFDREWRVSYVNAEAERLLGVSRADVLGRRAADVFPDFERTEAHTRLQRVLAVGERVEFEQFHPRLERWFFGKAYPVEAGVTLHFRDITAQKDAAAALARSRDLLESELADSLALQGLSATLIHHGDVAALYDAVLATAMRLVSAQAATLHICDGDPASGVPIRLRLLASRGFDPAASERWTWVDGASPDACADAFRTGARVEVADVRASEAPVGADRVQDYVHAGIVGTQSTPLISRSGQLLGVLSTHWSVPHACSAREVRLLDILARQATDIIERHQSEEALRDADRRKDVFLATLAHELRNPLAPIRSAIQVLKARAVDDDSARVCDIAERQTAAMSRLLDDLLDVGRIAKDRLQLKSEPVDLRAIVRHAVEMSAPVIESARHQVDVALPPSAVWVFGDPVRLTQIVGNLLNNACRYTEPDGRIRLSLETDGAEASITVADNGIGIPRKHLSSIFEMFSQVDSSLTRSQGGIGLGLHLVKRLTELHAGRIEAYSEGPGTGSTFVLRLPVLEPGAEPRGAEETVVASVDGVGRRVLIVDDNADGAAMLSTLLAFSGYRTEVAGNGSEALAAADVFRPDAVLLDIGLPDMDGYDVCRRLRARPWGDAVTVIGVTGWGQDRDRARSRDAGFDHHLVKPVEHDTLLRLLASLPGRTVA